MVLEKASCLPMGSRILERRSQWAAPVNSQVFSPERWRRSSKANRPSPTSLLPTFRCKLISYFEASGSDRADSYNEQVNDLLDTTPISRIDEGRKNLKVKVTEERVMVENLKEVAISSLEEGMSLLEQGRNNRSVNDNSINQGSSRSHTVFILRLNQSRLYIVDLAGSERSKRTQTHGVRLVEASNINKSLSALMKCLEALRVNQKYARLYPDKAKERNPFRAVPFRESKLTLLFRDCLRGKNSSSVAMIVNASAEPDDFEETLQAVRYGELTKSTIVEQSSSSQNASSQAIANSKRYDYNGRIVRAGAAVIVPKAPELPPNETLDHQEHHHPLVIPSVRKASTPFQIAATPKTNTDEEKRLREENIELKAAYQSLEMNLREQMVQKIHQARVETEQHYATKMEQVKRSALAEATQEVEEQIASLQETQDLLASNLRESEDELHRKEEQHVKELDDLQRQLNQAKRAQINDPAQGTVPWMIVNERKQKQELQKQVDYWKKEAEEWKLKFTVEQEAHALSIETFTEQQAQTMGEIETLRHSKRDFSSNVLSPIVQNVTKNPGSASCKRPTVEKLQQIREKENLL